MSHLVLARKWRPKQFSEVRGQNTVVAILKSALDTNRLHHAYLFTGTRGVGKTTLARLLAKSMSCERGISSTPCDQCHICVAINAGSYVDVIEIDAASRTKVEDTREILDNTQYVPALGRFKIYIIDEVHMLSNHSFNALLKTLEEPPPHVKFLLATTEMKKLPAPVISRCLQLNLRHLTVPEITQQLREILASENIIYENDALKLIAKKAHGSSRDALSLLEQVIAFSNQEVTSHTVAKVVGLHDSEKILELIAAIIAQDLTNALAITALFAEHGVDFFTLLTELQSILYYIALVQMGVDPGTHDTLTYDVAKIRELAKMLDQTTLQLYYQITLLGQRDLPYAPSLKLGFEMILLRMISFHVVENYTENSTIITTAQKPMPVIEMQDQVVASSQKQIVSKDIHEPAALAVAAEIIINPDNWSKIVAQLKLTGILRQVAENCVLESFDNNVIQLTLNHAQQPLLQDHHEQKLQDALVNYCGRNIKVKINIGKMDAQNKQETPADERVRLQAKQQQAAEKQVLEHPIINDIIKAFDARIETVTIVE